MSLFRIQIKDGKKIMTSVKDQEEYRNLRSSEKQLENLKQARLGNEDAKLRLEQFNYSCLPNPDGTLKGATRVGNSVGMDIDHLATLQETIDKVFAKQDELGLLMMERSARGQGLHIVFRRHTDMDNEQNLRWASDLLGVEYDQGAKDITRVFFATSSNVNDLLFLSDDLFNNEEVMVSSVSGSTTVSASDTTTNSYVSNASEEIAADQNAVDATPEADKVTENLTYEGIPYADIINRWWEMHYNSKEPVMGNRQVRTFELVSCLRNICGFNRELMDKVIPCYSGFTEAEKLKCIDQALGEKMTQMPTKLKVVLASFGLEKAETPKTSTVSSGSGTKDVIADDLDENGDKSFRYENLPKLPQGVKDSVDAAGHTLAMPTLIAIAPAIGALATGVKLDVHGEVKGLNLCSFIAGEFASGKGKIDDIIASWMTELQAEADIYTRQEEEWAQKARSMKSGKVPEQPKLPVRMLTLNNTVANIAERLANTDGRHSFSFTPEADNVALKWKQSISDFSVMLRQAYDEARYDREAKSADAARVHIPKLLWNVTMCGTQDALYRVVTNYTDGLLSRIAIARTPDNTFSRLVEKPSHLTARQSERIQQVAHLLPFMSGNVVLPKLERQARQWLEKIRIESLNNYDRVLARQRMRGCVNAQRITVALTLPRVAEILIQKYGMNGAETRLKQNPEMWVGMLATQQNETMMKLFNIVADYLIDNDMYFFRTRLLRAYENDENQDMYAFRYHKGKNDNIFALLPREFTFEQAVMQATEARGYTITRNGVQQMLKNWKIQGLIQTIGRERYGKISVNP